MAADLAPAYTADEALTRLKEGNARFVSGEARFPTVQKEILAELAKGQQPYATILGCSDSRVPPELVFDAGFGELFVIRVAGNVLGPSILGTLQYAVAHLRTPLFVIMGHEGCGAVKAAHRLEVPWRAAEEPDRNPPREHRPRARRRRPRAGSRGIAGSGRRGECAPHDAGIARYARGEGPRGKGPGDPARGGGVRTRFRPRALPRVGTGIGDGSFRTVPRSFAGADEGAHELAVDFLRHRIGIDALSARGCRAHPGRVDARRLDADVLEACFGELARVIRIAQRAGDAARPTAPCSCGWPRAPRRARRHRRRRNGRRA